MKKKFLISGIIFLALGLALCAGALIYTGFDFSKFDTANYQTAEHVVSESFNNIEITATETDVELKPSSDGGTKIVCVELEKVRHAVVVENGVLKITEQDDRAWYERFNIRQKSLSITVFLPSDAYNALSVESGTGDFTATAAFNFVELRVKTSTGNINIENARAGKAELSVSTGDITLNSVVCDGEISADVSTGNLNFTDVDCKKLVSDGSTGNINLKNVVAEESFNLKRSTGDIRFESCDAGIITVETSTGDVQGTFRTEKIFAVKTSTGKIIVPNTTFGGKCEISTSTGDIIIGLA